MNPHERDVLAATLRHPAEALSTAEARDVTRPGDRLLKAREASVRLGMSTRWLYKHADELPFAVRTSDRAVRFSERGIEKWLLKRRTS